jgi:hypothetical protein
MDSRIKTLKNETSVRWTRRLLYLANAIFFVFFISMLVYPSIVATLMQGIEFLKLRLRKLNQVEVIILVALIFLIGTTLSVKVKKWRPVFIYLTALLLMTPCIPHIEVFLAKLLKITLRSLGSYTQMVTLLAMGSFLLLVLIRNQRYRYGRTYIALLAIVLGSAFVIKKLTSAAVETVHIVEYGGLAIVSFSVYRRQLKDRTLLECYLLSWDTTIIMGILDELYQLILPLRYCDIDDMLDNISSGIIGLVFVWGFLRPDQKRRQS